MGGEGQPKQDDRTHLRGQKDNILVAKAVVLVKELLDKVGDALP
jgi:hypothetical protein